MLTLQLRELERDGLVTRTVYPEVPPRVEYALTAPARGLLPAMEAMGVWPLRQHAGLEALSQGSGDGRRAAEPAGTRIVRSGNVRPFRVAK
jgi:DNA-binding HxlR family transcriptional regulator